MRRKGATSIGKAPLPSLQQPKLCITVSCYYKEEYSFSCSQELVIWSGLEGLLQNTRKRKHSS